MAKRKGVAKRVLHTDSFAVPNRAPLKWGATTAPDATLFLDHPLRDHPMIPSRSILSDVALACARAVEGFQVRSSVVRRN
eukprot:CAMPEP_0206526770 /NCGR_PEP_ID=MMETSP0325_2-20121206/943_1 /ASSEMBLY_ACC=CAM_ASM_000347 /TAXON_ID=2866 /ORGANISM="Crypthecodinium cohnii, Strain Seligo" /LENGTH=79 /DNA_ID=CAMNT_0054022037 /DNA_START=614 /DNA_END=853 /DNA_ORIENTATION=-